MFFVKICIKFEVFHHFYQTCFQRILFRDGDAPLHHVLGIYDPAACSCVHGCDNLLFKTSNMVDVLKCLNLDRYAVSWGALGIAMDCYNVALNYSNERTQFGKKISSFQLIQKKLVDMITEITKVQIMVWRLGKLMNAQQASYEQISMAKRTSVNMASDVARSARSILGGMGITSEYPIMRHILNLEVLKTYQGTEEIHTLITGKSITGIPAFR